MPLVYPGFIPFCSCPTLTVTNHFLLLSIYLNSPWTPWESVSLLSWSPYLPVGMVSLTSLRLWLCMTAHLPTSPAPFPSCLTPPSRCEGAPRPALSPSPGLPSIQSLTLPTGLRDPTLHQHESRHNFSSSRAFIYTSGLNHSGGGWEKAPGLLIGFCCWDAPAGRSRVRLSPSPALPGQQKPHPLSASIRKSAPHPLQVPITPFSLPLQAQ